MLWIDKYRPTDLSALDVHSDLTSRLKVMSSDNEIPHLLFYGPSGAGKRTRVLALLKGIFGHGVEKVRLEHRTFKTPSNKVIELTTVASNYHIEISPADAGIYDRFVIQDVIKEIAGSGNLAAMFHGNETVNADGRSNVPQFKVVLLTGVDSLTKQAQAALRRTMEKYSGNCRLILTCSSISKVLDPLQSRCLCVRVPLPTNGEICAVLKKICQKEAIELPEGLAKRIAEASGRNLRKAILMLETCQTDQLPLTADQQVSLADWEMYIDSIAKDILMEQTPSVLSNVRSKFYELLVNCIPAQVILARLVRTLLKKTDDDTIRHELLHWAAFYDTRLQQNSKEIFHLEAFVAKFMCVYKNYIMTVFALWHSFIVFLVKLYLFTENCVSDF